MFISKISETDRGETRNPVALCCSIKIAALLPPLSATGVGERVHGSGARLRFAGCSAPRRAPGAPRRGPSGCEPRVPAARGRQQRRSAARSSCGTIRAASKQNTPCWSELRSDPRTDRPAKKANKRGGRAPEARAHRRDRGSAWRKLAECGDAAQLSDEERAAVKRQLALDLLREQKA